MAGMIWARDGEYLYSPKISNEFFMAIQPLMRFRAFADVESALGLNKGSIWQWTAVSDLAMRGGRLVETLPIPETNFTVSKNFLEITEYANSVPLTEKLLDMAEAPIKRIVKNALANDAAKTTDIEVFNVFKTTPLRVVPTGGTATDSVVLTSDGVPAAANNVALGKDHIKAIVDEMDERGIPRFPSGDYFAISHVTTWRPFRNEMEELHQYTESGINRIMNGEIGRYEGVRFFSQSHIPKGGAADSTIFNPQRNVGEPWDNGKSSWAFFFGPETVIEAVALPEEVRGKIAADYGRDQGLAWYGLLGWGLTHQDPLQARVVMWDSAA